MLLNLLLVRCGVEETICLSDAPMRKAGLGGDPGQGLSPGCFLIFSGTSWSPNGVVPIPKYWPGGSRRTKS